MAARCSLAIGDKGFWAGSCANRAWPVALPLAVSAQALQKGIVAHPLSSHAVGGDGPVWNGLMLGYAQVPAEQMDAAVKKLAVIIRQYR